MSFFYRTEEVLSPLVHNSVYLRELTVLGRSTGLPMLLEEGAAIFWRHRLLVLQLCLLVFNQATMTTAAVQHRCANANIAPDRWTDGPT